MSSLAEAPINHRRKADLAYEWLRERIIDGGFAPGRRLALEELARETGLSHMPVRQALLRLEREGLVEGEAHKGMRVARLRLEDAGELFEIRAELEGLAAARAAESGETGIVSVLESLNETFGAAFRSGDYRAMGEANWALHRRILAVAGSGQLARMLEDVWARSFRFRLGYRLIPGRAEATLAEHARMIAAIGQGDAEAARAAARNHVLRAWDDLARMLAEEEQA